MGYKVPAGISNKHVHVSKEDFEVLFGKDFEMTNFKDLSQPGQFATDQKVDIIGPRGTLANIRILGPYRPQTQVELSETDCYTIGIPIDVRESGKLAGTPGCTLKGPNGSVELKEGVMVALRHVHLSGPQAEEAGVKDGDIVKVKFDGPRGITFDNVLIRAGEKHYRDMHLDTDEANAAGLTNGQEGEIIK
ncbi:MAG: phosphate propanoyltransferase [Firmicutes bacterium]|nr:phosphate propanoyltransferase [Bacillota bacterium]